jgi:hypothetical protein
MANKTERLQRMIRLYKEETGNHEVDMKQVALFAKDKGWRMTEPKDPVDLLAQDLARAAREEIRHDGVTGRPYRANHAVPAASGQFTFWVDIDEKPPRKHMLKSLTNRREQMVGDGLQLTYDAEYWSSINPTEEPIQIELDFTFDVELRKHADDEDKAEAI